MKYLMTVQWQWWMWPLAEICFGLIIALLLRRFVCVLAYVKGRSMQDTLQDGEVVFARRVRRQTQIRRFDVVLCRYPNRKGLFVKRVVGLPGETIYIEEGVLYADGVPVAEDFPRRSCLRPMSERSVPEGTYFVMGDNRPASKDSRSVGPIGREQIIAVAKRVVFPLRKMRKIP